MPLTFIEKPYHLITCFAKIEEKQKMDSCKILVFDDKHHDPELLREIMEHIRAGTDMLAIGICTGRHEPVSIHDASERSDVPMIIGPLNQEEEIQEMRHSLLALAIGHTMILNIRPLAEDMLARIVLGTVYRKTGSDMQGLYRCKHQETPVAIGHTIPMKRKVPRGINRDNHGRPMRQKPTPARLTRRNGSRK